MKRVALYVRVSTQEQKKYGYSVDSQIDALRKYCEDNGYTVMGLYDDAGISARKRYTKRPALMRLLNDCKDGKVDLILFTKLDRWSRNVSNYYEIQAKLEEYKVPWRTIWEEYSTEEADSAARLRLNILLSVAEAEADRTSERIKAVFKYKRERGEIITGNLPAGFKNEGGHMVLDDTAPIYAEVFAAYANGLPVQKVIELAREKGLRMNRNMLTADLKHPAYREYGVIPPDVAEKIDERRSEHRIRSVNPERPFPYFQGMCRCGYCGCNVGYKSAKRFSQAKGQYFTKRYECNNKLNKVHAEKYGTLPSIMEYILEGIILDSLEAEIEKYNISVNNVLSSREVVDNQAKISKLNSRLSRLSDLYEIGDLTKEKYLDKRSEIKNEIEILNNAVEVPKPIPKLPPDWKEAYYQLSDEGKSEFWHSSIKEIIIYKNREIRIKL